MGERIPMGRRRSSEMIMESILMSCAGGASKTSVIYRSNMNSTTIRPYIDTLLNNHLLEVDQTDGVIYRTTIRGQEFLKNLRQHNEELMKLTSVLAITFLTISLGNLWSFATLLDLP